MFAADDDDDAVDDAADAADAAEPFDTGVIDTRASLLKK
jgi:hypothetical protein